MEVQFEFGEVVDEGVHCCEGESLSEWQIWMDDSEHNRGDRRSSHLVISGLSTTIPTAHLYKNLTDIDSETANSRTDIFRKVDRQVRLRT